jgi:spore coat polysaccharide biosynthesis protein SpsF (cytidylyltransferase family)
MNKRAIFITVRSDSSRLPNKAYREILGVPVIEMIIKRARLSKNANMVVVCTTERQIDDKISEIAKNCEVQCFCGSLNDKLERWNGAANKFEIDLIATFDGDDLLCSPELIDLAFEQIENEQLDYMKSPDGLVCGAFTYCFTSKALEKVCYIKNTEDTEMMWTYFEDTGLFKVGTLKVNDKIYINPDIRLTLDYQEDFDFFEKVFTHFGNYENDIPLKTVLEYLDGHPEIIAINSVKQKEWRQNQINKTKLLLK